MSRHARCARCRRAPPASRDASSASCCDRNPSSFSSSYPFKTETTASPNAVVPKLPPRSAPRQPSASIFATAASIRAALASRSEEHTSELQSLMRISYAVFCLKKKNTKHKNDHKQYTKTLIDKHKYA